MEIPFVPERVLKRLLSRGGEFGEIFVEELRTLQVHLEDGRVEKVVPGHDRGVGIRLIRGGRTFYGWTCSLDGKNLEEVAESVSRLEEGSGDSVSLSLPNERSEASIFPEKDADTVPFERKLKLIEEAGKIAGSSPLVKNVRVVYGDAVRKIAVFNSLGTSVSSSVPYILLAVQVVAEEGGTLQRGYETVGGTVGWEAFDDGAHIQTAEKASFRAVQAVKARRAPGGRMPVVISSEAGGTMIHEAVGHGLEADLAAGKLSVYTGRIGEEIASPLVTVIDDPTIPGKRGSYPVDDEGTPASPTILIEKGILKGYMSDILQHLREGVPLTGNGRRESFRHRPIPRMSNTYIAPGDSDPEEIVRSVERGFFVKKMGGGQVNTVTGDFVFEVQEGYLIEKGKVGDPVRGATLTGNGPEVLKMIDMVGNDLGFGLGTCGKDGQGVPVGDAQPTIRIGEPFITVGGEGEK
ncbi:MAG: TldD/PmbA family protein [Deltaproteobacteria bacterium]|nr:MAG: TldD/PmbA family protein [Deltaproteobacteria bacterium]